MAICARDGCDNLLRTGKKYCSTGCAARERARVRKEAIHQLPEGLPSALLEQLGPEGREVLVEMRHLILQENTITAPLVGRTQGDVTVTYWVGGGDRRPGDALSYDLITEMMKSGPILFVLEMKLAALMSVWRNERSWRIYCPDSELQEIVQANMRQILPRAALDFVRSALIYGTSFSELVWEPKTRYELGLSKSRAATRSFFVSKVPLSCNPETIDRIERQANGDFNGFVQKPKFGRSLEIRVPAEQALVIPYRGMFRNLWGESFLKPIYPLWFWFEVALRSWVRFMERQGTPVAVCYAPSRGKVRKPGSDTLVDAITWGLAVAGNIAKSNAAVMPSDVHPDTKQPLWRLEYLKADDRGQVFSSAIEMLMQLIVRASLSADRAITQSSGGVGSYNIGEIHDAATQLHNELILIEMVNYINQYWLPRFSLYNRGVNGPPIWLETEGLDPREKDRLFKLFNIAGNAEGFNDALMMVDWRRLFEVNNVPTLEEDEVEKLKKEAQKKQQQFIQPAKQPEPQAENRQPQDDNDQKMKNLAQRMSSGEYVPIILSDTQMKYLTDRLQLAEKIDVESGNPWRGPGGRFASPTTPDEKAKAGDILQLLKLGLITEEQASFLKQIDMPPDVQESVLNLYGSGLHFKDPQEAYDYAVQTLYDLGIRIPDDINFVTQTVAPWIAGYWEEQTNTIALNADISKALTEGQPFAFNVLIHELLHAIHSRGIDISEEEKKGIAELLRTQGIEPTPEAIAKSKKSIIDMSLLGNLVDLNEGANTVLECLVLSQLYKTPISPASLRIAQALWQIGNGEKDIQAAVAEHRSWIMAGSYSNQSELSAALIMMYMRKTGMSLMATVRYVQSLGINQEEYSQFIAKIFPEAMARTKERKHYVPSMEELIDWMKEFDVLPHKNIPIRATDYQTATTKEHRMNVYNLTKELLKEISQKQRPPGVKRALES